MDPLATFAAAFQPAGSAAGGSTMRSELFCALSLSALLVACAHDKGPRAEHHPPQQPQAEAEAEHAQPAKAEHAHAQPAKAEHAQRQAAADRDHDGVDSDGDGHDKDRLDRDGDGRDKDRVAVPERNERDRARMATAGDELPRTDDTHRERAATNARAGTELNPLDQGSSEIDMGLTQRIRKAVMDDDSLSFKAKNVKIITRDGHVTLRGSVKTPEEKAAIGNSAVAAAGMAHVTNQIEIGE
jgi:osmotically-inducible protein OsmY